MLAGQSAISIQLEVKLVYLVSFGGYDLLVGYKYASVRSG